MVFDYLVVLTDFNDFIPPFLRQNVFCYEDVNLDNHLSVCEQFLVQVLNVRLNNWTPHWVKDDLH